MRNHRWFLIILIIFLLGFFSHSLYLKKTVYGDGIYYYSWLRSAVIDHDLNFHNEYRHFGIAEQPTPNGSTGNKFAIGPAILWSPSFIWLYTIMRNSGYELSYQLIVGLTSLLYAVFGLILLYRLLTKFFPDGVSRLTVLSLALATNLFYYGSLDTVNSHAVSFFAVAVFLSLLLREKKNWIMIGLSLGLIALIRSQDIVLGLLILPFINLRKLPLLILGTVAGFLPQLLAWQIIYGKLWISPYLLRGDYFDFFHPRILQALFAPWSGFILWSPVVICGIFSLFFWKNKLKLYILLVILIEIIILATYSEGQGATVGSRYMISTLPLIGFGLAYFFNNLLKRLDLKIIFFTIIAPLSALNFLLTFVFLWLH